MIIGKEFKFNAAHKLPNYNGKCKNLHGHTWKLIISLEGKVNKDTGMIVDFKELKAQVKEQVLDKLDHGYLNEIIDNPTCENLLTWIKENLKIKDLKSIKLYESENSWCGLEI